MLCVASPYKLWFNLYDIKEVMTQEFLLHAPRCPDFDRTFTSSHQNLVLSYRKHRVKYSTVVFYLHPPYNSRYFHVRSVNVLSYDVDSYPKKPSLGSLFLSCCHDRRYT